MLPIEKQTSHSPGVSGAVPKAKLSGARWTTATCNAPEKATAPYSQRLTNRWLNALTVSERALKQLKSWAKTKTVNPAVRA